MKKRYLFPFLLGKNGRSSARILHLKFSSRNLNGTEGEVQNLNPGRGRTREYDLSVGCGRVGFEACMRSLRTKG